MPLVLDEVNLVALHLVLWVYPIQALLMILGLKYLLLLP